jgi:transposase
MRRGVLASKRPVTTANGIMEAVNSFVQAAKAKARGYRSIRNLKAIIYLIAGKLELPLPT